MFFQNLITVFLKEAINLVLNIVSKMEDDEGCLGHAWLLKVLGLGVLVIQLLAPVLVRASRHLPHTHTLHHTRILRDQEQSTPTHSAYTLSGMHSKGVGCL